MNIISDYVPFRANFVNKINAAKQVAGHYPLYKNETVNFFKINPLNPDDIKALEDAAKYWLNEKFAANIYYAACALKDKNKKYKDHQIYVLTSQISDFYKLNSDKLLGLVHTSPCQDGFTHIENLQVYPEFVYNIEPEYRGIGTGILDSLKQIYNKLSCNPLKEDYVIKFYEKNNFVKQPDTDNYYTYVK